MKRRYKMDQSGSRDREQYAPAHYAMRVDKHNDTMKYGMGIGSEPRSPARSFLQYGKPRARRPVRLIVTVFEAFSTQIEH